MAEKIIIAQVDIDTQALIKSASETKKQILELAKTQSDLKKSGEDASSGFVQNEAQLKSLQGTYREQQATIQQLVTSNGTLLTSENALDIAMSKEIKTVQEASANNRELVKMRNQVDATTDEGAKTIAVLNQKIDQNTNFIKANGSQMEQQRMNIGNYGSAIKDAVANINPMNGGLQGFLQRSQEAGGAGNLLQNSFKALTQGIIGFTRASLAFIATPVGAVIAAIVLAVTILYNVFKGFTPIVDKVEQAMASVGAVLTVVKNAVIALVTGAKSLGDVFSNLGGSMRDAAKAAGELKKAQQDLDDAMAEQEVQSAKNKNAIDKLLIQSRDRSKSEAERIKIIEQASKLEEQDFNQRKKNSSELLRQAQETIKQSAQLTDAEFKALQKQGLKFKEYTEKKTTNNDEMYDNLKKALLEQTKLEGESNVSQEKLIMRKNVLLESADKKAEKSAQDKQKAVADAEARAEKNAQAEQKRLDDVATKMQLELDLYIASNQVKNQTLNQELALAKSVSEKKLAILQAEFNASDKTENDKLTLIKAQNDVKTELITKQLELTKENTKADLDLFIAQNTSKLEGAKTLTQELINAETVRLEAIVLKKEGILETEFNTNQQVIDAKIANNETLTNADKEYLASKIVLEDEANKQIQANKDAFDLQIKEQKASQLQADYEIKLQTASDQFEAERIIAQEQYNTEIADNTLKLEKGLLTKQQFIDKEVIATNKKNEAIKKANLGELGAYLGFMSQMMGGLQELFGKNKELASAMAVINGALAVTEIWAGKSVLPEPMASIAKGVQTAVVVATTLKNVKQINSTNLETGGIVEIGGKRHSQGGTQFWGEDGTTFEAEAGEGIGVLNRSAFKSFMNFNNSNNSGGTSSPSFMAGGGIITRGVSQQGLNQDVLLSNTMKAIESMPPQVVTVEDINYKMQEVNYIEINSNF